MGSPAREFDEAFRTLFPLAHRVALRILGDSAEAEDAASEALARALVAWRRIGHLDHRDAWVMRVTANVAVDMVRRRPRPAPADHHGRNEEEGNVDRVLVRDALGRLPRRQREVLALRYLADLTEPEVARCLRISVGSVKRHAHRGMAAMRDRLPNRSESLEVRLALD